jgi:hypothetical protein
MRDYIRTFSGIQFPILEPQKECLSIVDIAHHLSNICRFTGATKFHYSVAQHCFVGSYLVAKEFAFEFLMHDAPEAYINDISRPLKYAHDMSGYRLLESIHWSNIAVRWGLPILHSAEVKLVDNRLCATEGVLLLRDYNPNTEPYGDVQLIKMAPEQAEQAFMRRYSELCPLHLL